MSQREDGTGDVPSGMGLFEFVVDPNEDPELALALRVSMEENRARLEEEAHNKTQESATEAGVTQATGKGESYVLHRTGHVPDEQVQAPNAPLTTSTEAYQLGTAHGARPVPVTNPLYRRVHTPGRTLSMDTSATAGYDKDFPPLSASGTASYMTPYYLPQGGTTINTSTWRPPGSYDGDSLPRIWYEQQQGMNTMSSPKAEPPRRRERKMLRIFDPSTGQDVSEQVLLNTTDPELGKDKHSKSDPVNVREQNLLGIVDPVTGEVFQERIEVKVNRTEPHKKTPDTGTAHGARPVPVTNPLYRRVHTPGRTLSMDTSATAGYDKDFPPLSASGTASYMTPYYLPQGGTTINTSTWRPPGSYDGDSLPRIWYEQQQGMNTMSSPKAEPPRRRERKMLRIFDPSTGQDVSEQVLLNTTDPELGKDKHSKSDPVNVREQNLLGIVDPVTGEVFQERIEVKVNRTEPHKKTPDTVLQLPERVLSVREELDLLKRFSTDFQLTPKNWESSEVMMTQGRNYDLEFIYNPSVQANQEMSSQVLPDVVTNPVNEGRKSEPHIPHRHDDETVGSKLRSMGDEIHVTSSPGQQQPTIDVPPGGEQEGYPYKRTRTISMEANIDTDSFDQRISDVLHDSYSTRSDHEEYFKMTLNRSQEDRELLLKVEQDFSSFIKESKGQFLKFPQMSSYNRMLVHRVAEFFGLDHDVDQSGKQVIVNRTPRTRLPYFSFKNYVKGREAPGEELENGNLKQPQSTTQGISSDPHLTDGDSLPDGGLSLPELLRKFRYPTGVPAGVLSSSGSLFWDGVSHQRLAEPLPMRSHALPKSFWEQSELPHSATAATATPILPSLSDKDKMEDLKGIEYEEFIKMTLKRFPEDKLLILQLEEELSDFIRSRHQYLKFVPMPLFNQTLVERVAVFYGLDHSLDQSGKCVIVNRTDRTRIPKFKLQEYVSKEGYPETQKEDTVAEDGAGSDKVHLEGIPTEACSSDAHLSSPEIMGRLTALRGDAVSRAFEYEEFIKAYLDKYPKDKAMALQLEQKLSDFITEHYYSTFIRMPSYNHMLVHRVAEFFGLERLNEESGAGVFIIRTPNTRIPVFKLKDHINDNEWRNNRPEKEISNVESASFDKVKQQTRNSDGSVRGCAEPPDLEELPYPVQESQMVGIPQHTCPIARINHDLKWMAKDIQALRDRLQHQPSHPVIIAVLDSGIYEQHPDLQGMILLSRNFVPSNASDGVSQEDDLRQDVKDHGTKVAGIIWQIAGNCTKILNLKVIRSTGTGSLLYIRNALTYIEQWDREHPDQKVDIILMSLGSSQYDQHVSQQLSRLGESKVIIAAAANDGNIKSDTIQFPAKHPSTIAIGSCDKDGNRCGYSSKGHELSFLFPGSDIQSTSSLHRVCGETHRYAKDSGTSLAAPHCAGITALLLVLIECSLGAQKRAFLTSSYHVKNILRDKNVCGRTPTVDDGYGMPDISRITEASLLTYIKEHIDVND